MNSNTEFKQNLFYPTQRPLTSEIMVRPSRSYWNDALHRFKKNNSSTMALFLVVFLFLFTLGGPFLWTRDPSRQDLSSVSTPPNFGSMALIVGEPLPFEPERAPAENSNTLADEPNTSTAGTSLTGKGTTQGVTLKWSPITHATGYVLYRNEVEPDKESLGVPIGDINDGLQISFEDNQSLETKTYYYTLLAKDANGTEIQPGIMIKVPVLTAITLDQLNSLGLKGSIGESIRLPSAPLGTDSLGRDLLARLMDGGRVSLFIGIIASVLTVLFGIFIGGMAGFLGGTCDSILMRITDLITGLPFLLCMILFKIVLNVGPGESGVTALLISLVLLSWTGTARLVRGQILQMRNNEYILAARLMGASSLYLIARHMLPNLLGVILVTLTFQIPSAIFTEAFLSFIGLGVAAPATSWGALCNDAIQSLLTRPYEFFAPALAISLTVLAFNLLGDGLRDALDPKLRSNE